MSALSAQEAYRRWAPAYDEENAFSAIECDLVERQSPSPRGMRLLDVGSGTGRRLVGTGALRAVGVEACVEMLSAARRTHAFGPEVWLLQGDARDLPLPDSLFDLVWCRLMIGHVPDCAPVYAEIARVTVPGARVVVTDFHPAAHEAGLRRTFRDGDEVLEIEHFVHPLQNHLAAAQASGLELVDVRDGVVGPEIRHYYEEALRLDDYQRQLGFPMVQALLYQRVGAERAF
jgi:ubiquinone/menaquinone biosynthesis C-methylase UbiE